MISDKVEKIINLNKKHGKVFDSITIFNFYWEQLSDVKKNLKDEKDFIYLDVGCGTGNLLSLFRDAYVVGVDISKAMLSRAKTKLWKKHNFDLILADANHLPLRNSSLDAVSSINMLYQLPQPSKFLEETYRVLKIGSPFILSTPHSQASFKQFTYYIISNEILRYNSLSFFQLFYKFPQLLYGHIVNKQIINTNPNAFYRKKRIKNLLKKFKIDKIIKTYANQNWLIVAYKNCES